MAENAEPRTYFSAPERLFPHLDHKKVPTAEFITACNGIGEFVGLLGTAFLPVKSDVLGNVEKVRKKYLSNPEKFPHLEEMVLSELKETGGNMGTASEGLLWLKRGLEFMLELLLGLVQIHKSGEKSDSLYNLLSECYERTLKHHHGFISRQLFKVVLAAAPSRSSLFRAMAYGKDGYEEYCVQHMETHLTNFRQCVHALVHFYTEKNLDRCYLTP